MPAVSGHRVRSLSNLWNLIAPTEAASTDYEPASDLRCWRNRACGPAPSALGPCEQQVVGVSRHPIVGWAAETPSNPRGGTGCGRTAAGRRERKGYNLLN